RALRPAALRVPAAGCAPQVTGHRRPATHHHRALRGCRFAEASMGRRVHGAELVCAARDASRREIAGEEVGNKLEVVDGGTGNGRRGVPSSAAAFTDGNERSGVRISIFGLGYVGAVSLACLARDGHEVIGVDVDQAKLDLIREGRTPVVEEGMVDLMTSVAAS